MSLIRVVQRIADLRPRYVALENVPQFAGSRAHAHLRQVLDRGGYDVREHTLCPTQLGIPNRRRRFYLVAGRTPLLAPEGDNTAQHVPLNDFLDEHSAGGLGVSQEFVEQYSAAMHLVEAGDLNAVTSCFTSAYGRSPVRAGSYLRERTGRVRRFSPAEILRLLGFHEPFQLPPGLAAERAWPLVGNSLSVAAVRRALSCIPELAGLIESAAAQA